MQKNTHNIPKFTDDEFLDFISENMRITRVSNRILKKKKIGIIRIPAIVYKIEYLDKNFKVVKSENIEWKDRDYYRTETLKFVAWTKPFNLAKIKRKFLKTFRYIEDVGFSLSFNDPEYFAIKKYIFGFLPINFKIENGLGRTSYEVFH